MHTVVVLINNLAFGGAERLAVDQVNEMHRRGIRVILITLRKERGDKSFVSICTIPESQRHYVPCASLFDWRAYSALMTILRLERPSIVITHLWFSNAVGRIAAYNVGVARIVSFEHNVYDAVKTWKQFLLDWVLQILSTNIIAVSSAVSRSLVRHGIQESRISVIENAIDLARYRDAPVSTIRDELMIRDAFLYLFVGRLIHQKGVDILLKAFAETKNSALLIVGEGNEAESLQEIVRTLHIANRVHFLGVRTDIPSLMKTADCFVLPSRWEGMPMVLLEALAVGMPIVVSDFASAREIVRDGQSGIIVPINDIQALSEALRLVATKSVIRGTSEQSGMEDAMRFSIQRHIDILLALCSHECLKKETE